MANVKYGGVYFCFCFFVFFEAKRKREGSRHSRTYTHTRPPRSLALHGERIKIDEEVKGGGGEK